MTVYANQLFRATNTTGFATLGANTFTAIQTITPAVNTGALVVTGYSLTGTNTSSLLDLAGTWNVGTTVETAIKLNILDTASGATSLLMDLQVGSSSLFKVSKGGVVTAGSFIPAGTFSNFGANVFVAGTLALASTSQFGWSSTSNPSGTQDTAVFRDAAGVLAQRNGVNAQVKRVYNTFTDASNYERGVFDWQATANTLTIGPQAAGTGTLRGVSAIGTWSFANAVMFTSSIALTNGAGAQLATLTNGPTAGNPTKWVPINDNGTTRYIPAW